MELLTPESGDQEMPIIDQHVADAGVGQVGGELRFPDPLREPEAAGIYPEAGPQPLVHPPDLLDAVAAGQ